MRICLLSQDSNLNQLCREMAESHAEQNLTFLADGRGEAVAGADLYLLELGTGMRLPAGITGEELRKSILVIGREDMAALRSSVPQVPLAVLLKPVNRARLEIAIEQARARVIGCTEMLRADRENLLQHLLQTNVKLQAYDQDRTNFLARAVHEFRAPLTSIHGLCDLLLGGYLGGLSLEQRGAIERMRHSVSRLSRLSSALFELSVGNKRERRPALERNDIMACIEQAVQVGCRLAQDRGITLDSDCQAPGADLYFAPDQLEQVLINLLENSCKFTPRGGHIQVRAYPYFWERRKLSGRPPAEEDRRRYASRKCNAYRVEIADNGPGIPREHMDTIFEEYTSYAGGGDRSGAGLGLAICKMILRVHQGRIWADSNGSGACFSVVLPYGEPEYAGQAHPYRAAAESTVASAV